VAVDDGEHPGGRISRQSRPSRRGSRAVRRVALSLAVGTVALGVLLNGAEAWWARLVVHVGVLAGLVACLTLPERRLERTGGVLRLLAVPAVVLVLALPTLIPLPAGLLSTLAPGVAAAFPEQSHALSIDPEATAYGLGVVGLLAGGIAVFALALPRRRGVYPERTAAVALLALTAVYVVHRLVQPEALYGLIAVRATAGAVSAPLINPNFVATVVLGLLPLALGGLLRRRHPGRPWTWVVALSVLAGLGTVAVVGSLGAFLVLPILLVIVGLRTFTGAWAPALGVGLGAVLFVPAVLLETWLDPGSSVDHRLDQWTRSLDLVPEFPVTGTGLGGYVRAFAPHSPPFYGSTFTHLHNDPGQWLLEFGLLPGLVVTGVLVFALWPTLRQRRDGTPWWITLGVLAMVLHSFVDFPLHLPGLLLLLALLLTWRVVGLGAPRQVSAGGMRLLLGGLIAVQLASIALTAWLGPVRELGPEILREPTPATLSWVETVAPWRGEPALARARDAARDGDTERALDLARQAIERDPDDAVILTGAAGVLAVAGELDQAATVLDRAIERDPADFRSRALASRVAEARGDRELALERWTQAIQRWPWPALTQDRPFDRAFELQPLGLYWLDALADGPAPSISVYLGYMLLERDEPYDALLAFEQAAAREERYRWVPRHGVAMARTGDVDGALEFLAQADAHDTTGEARLRRARLLMKLERYDEARDDAYLAMKKREDFVSARMIVLQATQRLEGPEAVLERARYVIGRPADAHPTEALYLAHTAESLARYPACVRWLTPHPGGGEAEELMARCQSACLTCSE